jgi:murein DD-endopeptidase MepM/ murein hydrolase activator NlpD
VFGVDPAMNNLCSLIGAFLLSLAVNFFVLAHAVRGETILVRAGIDSPFNAKSSPKETANTAKTFGTMNPTIDSHGAQWRSAVLALRQMHLRIPLDGFDPERMKGSYYQGRGTGMHQASDMLSARNTPIHAVSDGLIAKLFTSRFGGTTIYQFDPTRRYVFYYAHLQRYADGLAEGQTVKRGTVIGYVGTSGNAPPNTPHLHLSIGILGQDQRWWKSTPIDPYEVFVGSPIPQGTD